MTDTINTRHFFMQKWGLVSAFAIALVISVGITVLSKEMRSLENKNKESLVSKTIETINFDISQINREIDFLSKVEYKMREGKDWSDGVTGLMAIKEKVILTERFYGVMDCLSSKKLVKRTYLYGSSCTPRSYDNIIKQYNDVIREVASNGVTLDVLNRIESIHNSIYKAWQDAIKTSNLASAKMADYVLAYSDEFKPSDVQIMSLQSKSLVEAMSNVTWKNRHTQMDDLLIGITRPGEIKPLNLSSLRNQLENVNNVDYSKVGFAIFAVSLFVLVMSVFAYNRNTLAKAKKELETVENKIQEVVEIFKSTFAEAEEKAKVSQDGKTVEELETMIALAEKRSNEILAGKPSAEQAVIQAKAELDEAKHAVSEFNKTEDYRNRLAELSRLHEVLVKAEKNVTAKEQALDNARIAKEQAVDRQNRAYSMVSHEETHAAAKAEQDAEKDLELAQVAVLNAKKEHQAYGALFYGEYNTKEKRDSFNAIIEDFDANGLANAEQAVEKAQAIVDGYNQEIDKILTDVPMIQEKIESINKAWNIFASQEQTSLRKNSLASALAPLYEQKQKLEPLVSGLLPFTSKKKSEETEQPVNA